MAALAELVRTELQYFSRHRPLRDGQLEKGTLVFFFGSVCISTVLLQVFGTETVIDPLLIRFSIILVCGFALCKTWVSFVPSALQNNQHGTAAVLILLHCVYLMAMNGLHSTAGLISLIQCVLVVFTLSGLDKALNASALMVVTTILLAFAWQHSLALAVMIIGCAGLQSVLRHRIVEEEDVADAELDNRVQRICHLVKEIETHRLRAEQSSLFKSQFLSRISHEIRTPLSGILGMTSLAMDTELSIAQREYLDAVKFSSETLLTLVNDILDISKIEAGEMKLECIVFPLRDLLRKTMRGLWFRISQKGLRFDCRTEPGIEDLVQGDPTRLKQILTNLVGNALKFTEQGGIMVRVRKEEGHMLHFSVQDTGLGIDMEAQERLFRPFCQAEDSTSRKYGGTGLGLAICRELVQMMRGKIWVESAVGYGSTFHFTVHMPPATEQAAQAGVATSPSPPPALSLGGRRSSFLIGDRRLRVLLAEDDLINQRVTQLMLEKAGHEVVVVDNGLQAVQSILATVPYQRLLPMLQRGLLKDGGRTTVPAMVQYSLTRPRGNSIASSRSSVGSVADGEQSVPSSPKQKQREPHMSPMTPSGSLHDIEPPYDIVLMDIQMPELDGCEATRAIRDWERYAAEITGVRLHIPITALTACNMAGDRERCIEAGIDDFLAKPLEQVRLIEAVQGLQLIAAESRSGGTSPRASYSAISQADSRTSLLPSSLPPAHPTNSPKSQPLDSSQRWRITQEHRTSVPDLPAAVETMATTQRRYSMCDNLLRLPEVAHAEASTATNISPAPARQHGLPPISPAGMGRRNSYAWATTTPIIATTQSSPMTQPLPARHANSPDFRSRFDTPSPLRMNDAAAWLSSPVRVPSRRNTSTSSSPFGSMRSGLTGAAGSTIRSTPSSPSLRPINADSPLQTRMPTPSSFSQGQPQREFARADNSDGSHFYQPADLSAFTFARRLASQHEDDRLEEQAAAAGVDTTASVVSSEQPGEQPKQSEEQIFDSAWFSAHDAPEWPSLYSSPYLRTTRNSRALPAMARWRSAMIHNSSSLGVPHSADEAAAAVIAATQGSVSRSAAPGDGPRRASTLQSPIAFPTLFATDAEALQAKSVQSSDDESDAERDPSQFKGEAKDDLSRASTPSPVPVANVLAQSHSMPDTGMTVTATLEVASSISSSTVTSAAASCATPQSPPSAGSFGTTTASGDTSPHQQAIQQPSQAATQPSSQRSLTTPLTPRGLQALLSPSRSPLRAPVPSLHAAVEEPELSESRRSSLSSVPPQPPSHQTATTARLARPPRPLLHAASEGNLLKFSRRSQDRNKQAPEARREVHSPVHIPLSPAGDAASAASSVLSHLKRRSSFLSVDSMQYSTGSDVEPLSRLTSPPRRASGDAKPVTVLSVLQSVTISSPPRSASGDVSPGAGASPASARSTVVSGAGRVVPRSPTASFVPLTPPPRSPSYLAARRPLSSESLDEINLVVPAAATPLTSTTPTTPSSPLHTPPVLTFASNGDEQSVFAALPLPSMTPPLGPSSRSGDPSPGTPTLSEGPERQDSPRLSLPVPARRSSSMLLTMPTLLGDTSKRVLIVDDNTVNQSVLRAMVMKLGVPVEVAGDGEAALRLCVQGQFRYGLIMMDSHMPRLSGVECTRLLRESEARAGQPREPVVLFTADDCRGSHCVSADFDGCMHKPYMCKDVKRLLVKFGLITPSSAPDSHTLED